MFTVMMITKGEPHSKRFLGEALTLARIMGGKLLVGADDGGGENGISENDDITVVSVKSNGTLESVHDAVLALAPDGYVLRLDDDEKASPAMMQWLAAKHYETADHWKFPRGHFWGGEELMLYTPHLWPDHQTRLSLKSKAGGRNTIHCGSPFGGGELAPVAIEHHKFLVKDRAERQAIANRYDTVAQGAGSGMIAFSVPEVAYAGEEIRLVEFGDGYFDEDTVPYSWGDTVQF